MKPLHKTSVLTFLFFVWVLSSYAQTTKFRRGIFLHHSTGGRIWGLNQTSTTSVPQEISAYNTAHGLRGDNAVSLEERWWPVVPDDNEWSTWHAIFEDTNPLYDSIGTILQNNKIVVVKSCFPSSQITGIGSPADTLDPTTKTIFNYKWHWRSIIRVMRQHPENFFVIWTNAPLVASQTDSSQAQHADDFCRWAKDTLAQGLDAEFGAFPKNIYVFDFFHKLVGVDRELPLQYAEAADNSHPNDAATDLVAPQFVQEVFNSANNYETTSSAVEPFTQELVPEKSQLLQNYPNPFNPATVIRYQVSGYGKVTLDVFDLIGRKVATLVDEQKPQGSYTVVWNATHMPSGMYFARLSIGSNSQVKKMLLTK
jgi:hypothetical protein